MYISIAKTTLQFTRQMICKANGAEVTITFPKITKPRAEIAMMFPLSDVTKGNIKFGRQNSIMQMVLNHKSVPHLKANNGLQVTKTNIYNMDDAIRVQIANDECVKKARTKSVKFR